MWIYMPNTMVMSDFDQNPKNPNLQPIFSNYLKD